MGIITYIFLIFCIPALHCYGATNDTNNRIINGIPTYIEYFGFQISLARNGFHICGGSIVASNWVITAAHCLYDSRTQAFYQPSTLTVRAGLTFQSQVWFSQQRSVLGFAASSGDDLAIIYVTSFVWTPTVYPVRMTDITPVPKTPLFVTGWGRINSTQGELPNQLQSTFTFVQSSCFAAPRKFCTLYSNTMICNGDSGGPAVVWDRSSSEFILVGVASSILSPGYSSSGYPICDPAYSQQFVNIAIYRHILRPIIGF